MLVISCPKNVSESYSAEKKKRLITIELKKKIIDKHECNIHVVGIARQYDRNTSMICTILKINDIKAVTTAKGVTKLSKR